MTKKDIKIREPNTLIEAGQKLSREELVIWLWSMLSAKPIRKGKLAEEEIKDLKRKQKLPILVGEVNLKELQELFPEYFPPRKIKYYKQLLKRMEKKIAYEVNLNYYLDTLNKLGFDFLIEELDLPSPEEVEYYGISVIIAVSLLKTGKIKITFSPYITPLLLELKTRYTTYDFLQILELNSKYSITLYRLIKERLGLKQRDFTISLSSLQKIMNTSFKRWFDFQRKVLKPAVQEVNEKTKYTVEYKPIKVGRKVEKILFCIKQKVVSPLLKRGNNLRELLEELVKSFQKAGEEITEKEFIEVLLSLERLNPATVLWFLLHYPEGEARLYAWKHIQLTESSLDIKHPDRFLESLIKDKDPQLDWLLDQRTKDLIKEELKKLLENLKKKPLEV